MRLNSRMFIEPQQRFTIRKGTTTIGTGVFLDVLPPCTDEEKDRRARKKLMKKEIERLGFNPYDERMERFLKPGNFFGYDFVYGFGRNYPQFYLSLIGSFAKLHRHDHNPKIK